ncbi:MAG: hypothetical protein NTX59_09375 [Elusimicrobia bacterium]|nr:hypothetical protein [Elusimicrobiota bacterium]
MNKIILSVIAVAVSSSFVNAFELENVSAKDIVKLTQTGQIVVPAAQPLRGAVGIDQDWQNQDWEHAVLKATDGTQINIDYLARGLDSDPNFGDTAYVFADPVWVSVSNPRFSGGETVIVELSGNPDESLRLVYAGGGRFIGKTARSVTLLFHHHGVDYPQKQKLSVKVFGEPLTDPVSGTDTFTLSLPAHNNTSKVVSEAALSDVKAAESFSYQCASLDNNGPYGIREIKLEVNGRNKPLLFTFKANKEVTEKYLIDAAYTPKPGSSLEGFLKANGKDPDHTAYTEGTITPFYIEGQLLLGKGGVIKTSGAGYSWARYSCVR